MCRQVCCVLLWCLAMVDPCAIHICVCVRARCRASAVDDNMKKLSEQKASIQRSVSDLEASFKAKTASLDASNRGLSELVARAEAVGRMGQGKR